MDAIIGQGRVSKREYGIISERNIKARMSDGVEINVNLFRPDSDERFPALVAMAPFHLAYQDEYIWPSAARSSRVNGSPTVNIESIPRDFFVRRGYVKVTGSSRGTGGSGGVYQYVSEREIKDISDLIEWAADQPWCNGNVGIGGIAYYTALAPQVAALQPPHLKAIASMFSFWDDYRDFWWKGGILANGFLKWVNNLANNDIHSDRSVLLDELGEERFRAALERALSDRDISADPGLVEVLKDPFKPGHAAVLDILLHPLMCPYWEKRGSVIDFDKIKVPVYVGVVSHRPGGMIHWPDMKVPKKMVYVPPAYVDRPFYQFSWELLRWFDYWLKGLDTGIMDEPAVRIFVPGSDTWLTAEDFPVPGTKWIPFCLHENHSLCEIEPWPEAGSSSYDDSPENRGFLKYSSPPIVENTEIAGLASLNLYASCRGVDMNIFAGIYDADPDGKETCLCRGYLKASHREIDHELSKPWHPVHTHMDPRPVIPGQVVELSIAFSPISFSFKAGHRIVLKLSGADDEPENLFQTGQYHLTSRTPNTITVYHSAEYPSHLLLPITKGNIVGTYVSGGDISLKTKEFMKLE
ncbi:MAG: CocE/NonD family hydrolase [Deltaproteobacteria bacterium]|nr:CocE/NonD family hydrolase [Deltaproteobacteria bacterium]